MIKIASAAAKKAKSAPAVVIKIASAVAKKVKNVLADAIKIASAVAKKVKNVLADAIKIASAVAGKAKNVLAAVARIANAVVAVAKKVVSAAMLAFGLVLGGFFPGYYYYHAKMDANSVVVKGLAEMDVKADLAIWNIKFVVTGDDVIKAQQDMEKQKTVVQDFLIKNNIKAEEISVGRLETNDLMANPYRSNNDNNVRFILTQNITVKSANVDNIAKVLNKSGDLVAQGVIFNQDYGYPVSYLFTGLNNIKPQMLAEATKNAKEAAEEFAKNSGSKVGKIRHANQGVFSILPREQSAYASEMQEIEKKVRVVSTIEYWLE